MATNNRVIIEGNMGSEARTIKTDTTTFAAVSIATTDSYKDKDGNWQQNEPIWHNIVAFSPTVIKLLENLKEGARVKIEGSLSYRPFDTNMIKEETGEIIVKKEASIVAKTVEQAPLVKKTNKSDSQEPEMA